MSVLLLFLSKHTLWAFFLYFSYWYFSSSLQLLRSCRELSLNINYCIQIIFLLLLISGDIETIPDPCSKTQYTIDISHLNIRSIWKKIDSLIGLVTNFDILCFSETHLVASIFDQNLSFEGFDRIFRKDRNRFGGGILVYISNSLSVSRRADLEPANIECIWIEIRDPTSNFLLCCTYRPPNSDKSFWRNLSWSIDKASDISNKIVIVGDLNVDFLNIPHTHPSQWNTH